MIEIRHVFTNQVLYRVNADTLEGIDLSGEDLSGANLRGQNLSGANLTGATLCSASLSGADLSGTNLSNTDLRGAMLIGASLSGANLHGTNLSGANMGFTLLADCLNLHEAVGLTEIRHSGPSTLDVQTLRVSVTHLPHEFLQGVGYTMDEILALRELYSQAIQYYSCFLSHAEADSEFADRLIAGFRANDVSCWEYRRDMRGGQFWRTQINEAIKLHDKLVLVCSENSLLRRNVVDEIIAAIERERETGRQKLFPIRLDDFICSDEMLRIADEKMAAGEWREDWVRYVRAYHIPDFRNWRNPETYQAEFQKLLRDLKNPAER